MPPADRASAPSFERLARRALAEDRAALDRTTRAVLPRPVRAEGRVIAQGRGTLSGLQAAVAAARAVGLAVSRAGNDGTKVRPGTVVLTVRGDARAILRAERTILNLLMHASGVATATARAVRAAGGGRSALRVLATRKTLPGLRDLEKAAVIHGGGHPHRRDLSEAILVKTNHLALVRLEEAVRRARARAREGEAVEVEVRTAREALRAVRAGATSLLVDNASPMRARSVVAALRAERLRGRVSVELSGGITARNLRRYRSVGADAASLGSLTHSAVAVPFHLRLRPLPG